MCIFDERLWMRLSENIKRSGAIVDDQIINEYFYNLQISHDGIPKENIINHDETNCADDPGSTQVIVRRGSRHPERTMDLSSAASCLQYLMMVNLFLFALSIIQGISTLPR